MTRIEAEALKVDDRVMYDHNPRDSGTVVAPRNDHYLEIIWDDGDVSYLDTNDCEFIQRIPE